MSVDHPNDPAPGPEADALTRLGWLMRHPEPQRRAEFARRNPGPKKLPTSNLGVKGPITRDEIYRDRP